MDNRNNLALLLLMFLVTLLFGCIEKGSYSSCDPLWMNCPGTLNDYLICSSASDLYQDVSGGVRYYSYYNCGLEKRTPTLIAPEDCEPTFR